MVGYWNRPEDTAKTIVDGWLHTGDIAIVDKDGYIYISDRIKDMIISGGENVYPAEIENVLLGHPKIADVAVIGRPSERWGETPLAVVVRSDDVADRGRRRGVHRRQARPLQAADRLPCSSTRSRATRPARPSSASCASSSPTPRPDRSGSEPRRDSNPGPPPCHGGALTN